MTKRTLFICEKPNAAKSIQIIMKQQDTVILAQCIAAYEFDYQDISFSESPYTKEEPKYKFKGNNLNVFNVGSVDFEGKYIDCPQLINIYNLKQKINKEKEFQHKFENEIEKYFSQFNEIIYICDPDLSGYRGFTFRMEKYFELGENWIDYFEKLNIKITAIKLEAFNNDMLIKSYNERTNFKNNEFLKMLKSNYMKKDFFEYNYNLNSILFFNNALNMVGHIKKDTDVTLTKNYISTLFLINKTKLSEGDLIIHMERNYIANPSSLTTLIDNLKLMNLIFVNDLKKFELTEKGTNFISKMHNKINDSQIGLRLLLNNFEDSSQIYGFGKQKLNNLSLKDFKIKYEKYLYNTFSKQKRFLRKFN
jgi:DNA topoisomerase IA